MQEPPADLLEVSQGTSIGCPEGSTLGDGGLVQLVARQAVAPRVVSGGDGGGVDPGDRRAHRVGSDAVDPLVAESRDRRRGVLIDQVRSQPVDHEDDLQGRGGHGTPSCAGRAAGPLGCGTARPTG